MMRYAAAAEYLGIAKGTLANRISARTGPRSVKMGRSRMFRQQDLDDFIVEKLIETERLEKRRARRRGRAAMVITCASPDLFLISIMMIAGAVLLLFSFLHTQ
ncbi:MAG: helix-turn-helix domain-containing protein [Gluconacetobacter sp.]